jgi:lysophospholipase L1-like esterase
MMTFRKQLLYAFWLLFFTIVLLEVGLRLYFTTRVGTNILFYGTPAYRNEQNIRFERGRDSWKKKNYKNRTVEFHDAQFDKYFKFFPNEVKVDTDPDTGEVFETVINSRGFRGPEFDTDPGAAVRVVTLGASSTFGFYNKDHTTYPYILEGLLNEGCPNGPEFEVLNFGIPKSSSDNILAMFLAEVVPLQPAVVTFYEGANDSRIQDPGTSWSFSEKALVRLNETSLLAHYISYLVKGREGSNIQKYSEEYARIRSDHFIRNINEIYETATANDTLFIVANQQRKSYSIEREDLQGVTFQQELDMVQAKYAQGEELESYEASFLIHEQIMNDLESWASQNQVTFVDMMELLDGDRQLLLSWVHLHADANRRIAEAFAKVILQKKCSAVPADARQLTGSE